MKGYETMILRANVISEETEVAKETDWEMQSKNR